MKKNTKLTLAQLIDRAAQRKEAKLEFKKFYVESLDAYVIAKKPNREIMEDSFEREDGDNYCVYECVIEPNLKDPSLHEAYDVKHRPLDIVEKVFELGEIRNLARAFTSWLGYDSDSIKEVNEIDNIKN